MDVREAREIKYLYDKSRTPGGLTDIERLHASIDLKMACGDKAINWSRGFLSAIDQVKATEIKETSLALDRLLKLLMTGEPITPQMFAEVAIASTKFSSAIDKLNAVLGEERGEIR